MPLDAGLAHLVEQQIRERVRQVARQREQPVVRVGIDGDRHRSERGDEAVQGAVALGVGGGARGEKPGRSREELRPRVRRPLRLGSRDGMAADETRIGDCSADRALGRADVGDGRLGAAASTCSTSAGSIVTGAATTTISASRTACSSEPAGSTAPRSPARASASPSVSNPSTDSTPAARAASATDAPTSPVPMIARRVTARQYRPCPRERPQARISSAMPKARSSDWRAFSRGSQSVS